MTAQTQEMTELWNVIKKTALDLLYLYKHGGLID